MLKKYGNYAMAFIKLLKYRICNTRSPIFTALAVTSRCNYRCAYCYGDYYNQKGENFSTQELLKIIDELRKAGALIVNLIGGEPLLRDDIGILSERVKKNNMICHLSSNASLIPEKAKELKNIDMLDTSLDGLRENNDKNRGEGTFDKTLDGIQCAARVGVKTNVNTVLTRSNVSDIDALVELSADMGFSLSFNLVFESHSCQHINYRDSIGIKSGDDSLIKGAIKKIIAYKKKGYPIRFSNAAYKYALNWPLAYNQNVYMKSLSGCKGFRPLKCFFNRFHCYIDADGRMYNCMHLKDKMPVINIKDSGVTQAWKKSSSFKNECIACYTICNNDANLIFGLKPSALWAAFFELIRSKHKQDKMTQKINIDTESFKKNGKAQSPEKELYILQKSLMGPSLLGRLGIRKLPLIPVKLFFKNCPVLDVGCGDGIFLKLYRNTVGVDTNSFMVEDCLRQGFSAKRGDLDDLSAFENESFGGVFLSHVLEHIKEPKLNEVHRVLKTGGKLIVEVPINEAGFKSNPTHTHHFTEEELKILVLSSGFKILKRGYILPFLKEYIHNHYRIYAVKAEK